MIGKKNDMRIPLDISWIKAHLADALIQIDSISNKLLYSIDPEGNVVFPKDVSINNSSTNYSITNLFDVVKNLKQQIDNLNFANNVNEFITNLEAIKLSIAQLQNNLIGLYRNGQASITHIIDNVSAHNDITFTGENGINASIIAAGGRFGFTDDSVVYAKGYNKTSEITTYNIDEWHPDNNFQDVNTLYLISLLNGHYNNDKSVITFDKVDGEIVFHYPTTSQSNEYDFVLHFDEGTAVVDNTHLVINFVLSPQSSFTQYEYSKTIEGLEYTYPKTTYYIKVDNPTQNTISFESSNYKLNISTHEIECSANNPKLYIVENSRTFYLSNSNDDETDQKISVIIFTRGTSDDTTTYINACVPDHSVSEEVWQAFENSIHMEDQSMSKFEYNGMTVEKYPNGGNTIIFEQNGDIVFNQDGNIYAGETPVISTNYSSNTATLNLDKVSEIKFGSDSDNQPTISVNNNSLNMRRLNTINFGSSNNDPAISFDGTDFCITANAKFTYSIDGKEKSITINDLLLSDQKEINILRDRIITLERINNYQSSNYIRNYPSGIGAQDTPTDAAIIGKYYLNPGDIPTTPSGKLPDDKRHTGEELPTTE